MQPQSPPSVPHSPIIQSTAATAAVFRGKVANVVGKGQSLLFEIGGSMSRTAVHSYMFHLSVTSFVYGAFDDVETIHENLFSDN